MNVKNLIEELQKIENKELEVIMGRCDIPGFYEADSIEYLPIEGVCKRNLDVAERKHIADYPLHGYCLEPDNRDKVLLYVYP